MSAAKNVTSAKKDVEVQVHKRQLANGLTCLAIRNDTAPTASIIVSLDVDQRAETPELAGIGYLTGELLDEGTEKYDGDELAEQVEGLGAGLSCSARGASIHFVADDLDKSLDLLREVVLAPSFPQEAVKRVRSLVKAELTAEEEDARTVAAKRFRSLVYGEHPFARPGKGTRESVGRISPEEIRQFHSQIFVPQNAIVAGVGKIDPEEMLDGLEGTFSSWAGEEFVLPSVELPARRTEPYVEHIDFDSQQAHVFLGHLGIRRADPDYYKLLVMDHVLGFGPGFTSRIPRKLRDEMGLCYTVWAGIANSAGREPGMFTSYIGTSPQQVELAIEGFLREMHEIRKSLPTAEEISDVHAYLTGSYVWALERNAGLAAFATTVERFGLGDDFLQRYPELIRAVAAEDVREVAERHLDPESYTLVTLGPDAEGGAEGPEDPESPGSESS
jgi:zinc protease